MVARLYADENFSQRVVEALRTYGHDVLTSREAGQSDQKIADEAVLVFATDSGRAVLTFNRKHFIRLHEQGINHGGMIVCTQDANIDALAQRIHDAVGVHDDLSGKLIRIIRPNPPSAAT